MRRRQSKLPPNQVVGGDSFFKPKVQTKLAMGTPGDKYEVEADRMADQVVSKTGKGDAVQKMEGEEEVQQKPLAASVTPLVQKMGTSEEEAPVQKMEEEEPVQKMEEEEPVQAMEEEEPVQAMEEEEPVQAMEEEVQTKKANTPSTNSNIEGKLRKGSGGSKMDPATQTEMESGFGADFSNVNIHNDSEAAQMSQDIGAQAFTHGNDVYFNKGKYNPDSKEGKHLLAHELTHTIQQQNKNTDKNVQLREATWLERRAWLGFFDHYIPRKFLNNYMDDTANKITLTKQEMKDCNPIVRLTRSPKIRAEILRLKNDGGGSAAIDTTGWGGARTNGSLGNFTIHYKGTLTVNKDGTWAFQGTMRFTDYWDFDPKSFGTSGRSTAGEIKTRVGAYFLPGSPFHIDSESVNVSQTSSQKDATWGNNFVPVSVGDHGMRSAVDIEVGAGGGDVAGTVVGAKGGHLGADIGAIGGTDLGGELGAQSSEDLN